MIVVDANVALAWVLQDTEAHHRYSARIAELGTAGEGLIAPSVIVGEVANVLLKRGRDERWGAARIAEMAEVIDLFGVRLVEVRDPLSSIVRFALRHSVSGFDAFYLSLALSANAQLATLDRGLRSNARRAGVEIVAAA